MSLEKFRRQTENWQKSTTDVPENTQFQALAEYLKHHKDIKGLAKYVEEHILTTRNTVEKQKMKDVVDYLKIRYRQTKLEKLEELVTDYVKFILTLSGFCCQTFNFYFSILKLYTILFILHMFEISFHHYLIQLRPLRYIFCPNIHYNVFSFYPSITLYTSQFQMLLQIYY